MMKGKAINLQLKMKVSLNMVMILKIVNLFTTEIQAKCIIQRFENGIIE